MADQVFADDTTVCCCVPTGCLLTKSILLEELSNIVKVICNNDQCTVGEYMHKVCFDQWQETVLTYLRSSGRARNWNEKQRRQNLWTKKGYDLAYKACGCLCGKGHLRKDLDWKPPSQWVHSETTKKKKHRKKNDKPSLSFTGSHNGSVSSSQTIAEPRLRSASISSTYSCSPSLNETGYPYPLDDVDSPPPHSIREPLFARRQDYSSFNILPSHKFNAYHIQMEDERGLKKADDIRNFALSIFRANKVNHIPCVFCVSDMTVFDRYPLIDGTLFISPVRHHKNSVPVKISTDDSVIHYVNAVCVKCLDGPITPRCRFCLKSLDGSDVTLGTMYLYDILAAKPCCDNKFRCKNCAEIITPPEGEGMYYSRYSMKVMCFNCHAIDFHFVKHIMYYEL